MIILRNEWNRQKRYLFENFEAYLCFLQGKVLYKRDK